MVEASDAKNRGATRALGTRRVGASHIVEARSRVESSGTKGAERAEVPGFEKNEEAPCLAASQLNRAIVGGSLPSVVGGRPQAPSTISLTTRAMEAAVTSLSPLAE
jgi:hypothetical protein